MATLPSDGATDDLLTLDLPSPTPSYQAFINSSDFPSMLSNENNEQSLDITDLPPEQLEVIEQPCCSKLRARNEYLTTRRDTLWNKGVNSELKGPVIRIPLIYCLSNAQYYIGVSLTTIIDEKHDVRYKHPYVLESIDKKEQNDIDSGIVWYPITHRDQGGIKSFSDLRIVKVVEDELLKNGHLCLFHGYNKPSNNLPKFTSGRQIVLEYNLKSMVLAFNVGYKLTGTFPVILDHIPTAFSEEVLVEKTVKPNNDDNSTESVVQSYLPPTPCKQRKYAPRNGDTDGNQEVLVFCTRKIDERKYGPLQVTFVCDQSNVGWSTPIVASDVEVKDQMVSFRTPKFPSSISVMVPVKIILEQNNQVLDTFSYSYEPKYQCSTCLSFGAMRANSCGRRLSNKRIKVVPQMETGSDTDAIVPLCEDKPVLRQSKSKSQSQRSLSLSHSWSSSETNPTDDAQQLADRLQRIVVSLFVDDDYKSLLTLSRSVIERRPELLHHAITNHHSDLLIKFIPIAKIASLQHTNQLGDTLLLHAARLNRLDVVRALRERKDFVQLLKDRNHRGENIFHILASTGKSKEMLDLVMECVHRESIDVGEQFDDVDDDNHTPLQLAIMNNHLEATRHLFKHSKKDMYDADKHIGDNLIHLAVRYGDLTMLKYLLNEGRLIHLGNLSNKVMTPCELARSMNLNDKEEYLNTIYPQPASDTDESSEED